MMSRYAAALSIASVLFLVAADDATKPMKVDELAFKVPAAWKSEPTKGGMRKAQLKINPADGDADPAEVLVFEFANRAGTVEANVERWEKMFVGEDNDTPKSKSSKVKGKNVDATRVEVAGRYVASVTPGSPERYNKPGYRLVAAIVETDANAYFFRMIGPEKTVKAAAPAFDAMIGSMTKE